MNASTDPRSLAERFHALHFTDEILVLPNAWDHASAALIAAAGFPAIATTSVGLAVANGLPDGENLSREQNLGFAAAIAARAGLPVTADLEAGYGLEPEAVADTVAAAVAAGLAGCNIEDVAPGSGKLMDFDLAVARIRAGAAAARAAGSPFVLNARTDPYLTNEGDADTHFDAAVRRANAFLEAGATSVYVPGVTDAGTIGRLAAAIDGPLNAHVIGGRASPDLDAYRRLGVRRLSLGGSLMMAALTAVRDTLAAIRGGDLGFAAGTMSNGEMNALMRQWSDASG